MESVTLLVVLLALGGFGCLFLLFRSLQRLQDELHRQREAFQSDLLQVSRQMHDQLSGNAAVVKDYTRLMGEFQNRLGQLQKSTEAMIDIGKDISSLQDILRAPKLRGILGELFLEELLRQVLPQDHYVLQYTFRTGDKVDAVVLLGQGMVPVDAKFPLENFKRALEAPTEDEAKRARRQFVSDVKKHVDQIASKYILPEEGTFDFALMYLPAENVYYEAILKVVSEGEGPSLSEYALNRKVIPVSPNSFYAYLQAIVLGLRGLRIESSAREILGTLSQLRNDFLKFYEEFEKVGVHLGNSKASYERAQKRLDRLQGQLESIESHESPQAVPGAPSPG
jgi:DNA recombination protein RmuC